MRALRIIFTPVALLLSVSLVGFAQLTADREFVTGPGRFGLMIAAKPTEQKDTRFDLDKFSFNGTTYTWRQSDGPLVIIEYYDVSPATGLFLRPADRSRVVNAFKVSLVSGLQNVGITTAERPFQFQGFNGIEIRGTDRNLAARLFFANGRFYALQAAASDAKAFQEKISILKTFRPLPKDEYIARRIAESSPDPMPQTSRRGRPVSDAAANDLKGRVSIVTTEIEEGSAPRERSNDEYYDGFGDLLKEVNYIRGYPDNIASWGWIDGKRVHRIWLSRWPKREGNSNPRRGSER